MHMQLTQRNRASFWRRVSQCVGSLKNSIKAWVSRLNIGEKWVLIGCWNTQFSVTFHLNWFWGISVCFVWGIFSKSYSNQNCCFVCYCKHQSELCVSSGSADEFLAVRHTDTVPSLAISERINSTRCLHLSVSKQRTIRQSPVDRTNPDTHIHVHIKCNPHWLRGDVLPQS